MANIKLIRMSSGEDVVADIVQGEKGSGTVTVKNAIVAIPTQQGQLGFAPWAPILHKNKNTIDVDRRFIVFIAEVDSDVANQHKKMYGGVITEAQSVII
jgi:hypothetical protein